MANIFNNPFLSLCLTVILLPSSTLQSDYTPTDKIFINCGGPSNSTDSDGRKWTSDIGATFSTANTTTATAAVQKPSVPETPYMTARIFRSELTYSFPVSPGRIFIRLYFYPASYNGLDSSNAFFTVKSEPFILLRNFSAKLTTEALKIDYIMKEFSVNIQLNLLNITFTPSENSYGFINGIEILSHPDIYSTNGTKPVIDKTTALQKVYRLNVGGNTVLPSEDTGLYRTWAYDSSYLFSAASGVTEALDPNVKIGFPSGSPTYIAPLSVYTTLRSMGPSSSINQNYNLTWLFTVDSGFSYLVRLHFCEVSGLINKVNQRVFTVFLNNQTAEEKADVIAWAGRNGVPVHRDYVVSVPASPARGQMDFWVDLHPYIASKPQYYDAILNGLEIFKINDSTGNLAGQNPIRISKSEPDPLPNQSSKTSKSRIEKGVGGGVSALFIFGSILFAFYLFKKKGKENYSSVSQYGRSPSSLQSNHCRHFSLAEIKAATNGFSEALLIGLGGFGNVYSGEIDNGIKVAIKRGNPLSQQGVHEFQTEIGMLSKLRHKHLVSLIGYCEESSEMILVYDYMAQGTLREHLYRSEKPPLEWKKRLEICIGAARGLHYLHTGAKQTIIHRDVKTTNILLDENFVAKVSDFGLCKTGPSLDNTHVSTVVKGSFGYLDPEYFRRQKLTEKSDVYSYGVVLLEVLCARPALSPTLPKEQVSLADWAQRCYRTGLVEEIVDPFLKGKIEPECFSKFVETAVKCVSDVGIDRPSMGDVLWNLEFALQLQRSAEEPLDDRSKGMDGRDLSKCFDGNFMISKSSLVSEDSDESSPSAVFSQIMDPKGR